MTLQPSTGQGLCGLSKLRGYTLSFIVLNDPGHNTHILDRVAEWGATFNPFSFADYNLNGLSFKVPSSIPAGGYLVRAEQIGLHVPGAPQFYVSCGQIQVTGGGSAKPSTVSIPGYIQANDPGLTVNIYNPTPTAYKVPVCFVRFSCN